MTLGSERDGNESSGSLEDAGVDSVAMRSHNYRHNTVPHKLPRTPSSNSASNRGVSKQTCSTGDNGEKEAPPHVPPLTRKECRRLARDFVRRFSKGFVSGAGLYTAVRIVTSLLKNPFRKSIPLIWQGVLSRDCLAIASFLGLYPSVYHLLVHLLTRLRRKQDGWTYGIAGGLGGLSVALLDASRRQTLAFFTLSRALGASVSTMVTRGYLTSVPFFEVYVFCLCVSVMLYFVALDPTYLSEGYYRSVIKWSRDYSDAKLTRLFRTPGPDFLTCEEVGLHKGSCVRHRVRDLFESLPGFAKLYLPIHLAPWLIFKRKQMLNRPGFVLNSLAKNLFWSTSFLGGMVFLAKLTICVLRNASGRPPPLAGFIPAVAGAVCGLALFLERYNRRKELSFFVLPHFLTILYVAAKKSATVGPLLRVPHGFTLVFAISMSSVMHAYEREPQSLTQLINGILKFFFGPSASSRKDTLKMNGATSGTGLKTATSKNGLKHNNNHNGFVNGNHVSDNYRFEGSDQK